jgi:phosphopantetheinyl transferase
MPILQKFHSYSNTKLILWKIEETEQELIHLLDLPLSEKQKLENRKTPNHRLEFLASRASLCSLGISIKNLHFKENGAPYLDTQKFCSLSHTQNYSAAVVSQKQVGVDVEIYRENILKIFLLTRLWTAKESVYKAFGTAGIHFSSQIEVHSFSMSDKKGFAMLTHLGKEYSFTLHFHSIINGQLCMAILNS